MAAILKRRGGYEVRYRYRPDTQRARRFKLRTDAERIAGQAEVD